MPLTKTQLVDVAERVGWTFAETAAGVILASTGFGVAVWKAALFAGLIAAGKCVVAMQVGPPNAALPSPPVIPPPSSPPPPPAPPTP